MKRIKNITIIGLGLIGGSLALSLKKFNSGFNITGYDNIPEALSIALYRNIIDRAADNYEDAVKEADLVIIATPVRLIVEVANQIKDKLKKGAILTDVGSAKVNIVEKMNEILPPDVIFIGGHPMAGSENEGVLSARQDLFINAFYVLTPTDSTRTEELALLHSLFTKIGAKVITISPGEHDKIVSLISHLPHIISTNLVALVDDRQKELNNLFKLCAGGFRDMTRIAASNPKMWLDISFENKNEIINRMKISIQKRIFNMTDEDKKEKFSRPMEKNPNWKGGKTYNYCKCGKRIVENARCCNKCRPRSGKDNPFFEKHHTVETKNELSKKRIGKYNGTQNIKFSVDNVEYFSLGDAYNKLKTPIPTILWRLKSKNKRFENYKYI